MIFSSLAMNYDPNSRCTLRVIKRLERVANIPVLSDSNLMDKLSRIRTFAGFKLDYNNIIDDSDSSIPVIQYMSSWLRAYKNKECEVEPTWSKFLEALRDVGLTNLAERIEKCLESAPEVEQTVAKEGKPIYNFISYILTILYQ